MSDQPQKEKSANYESNFKWKSDELDDLIMKKIYEVYDIEEEPEESEESDEDEELEEEDDSLLNTANYDASCPLPSDEPPVSWDDSIVSFWKSLSATSKLLAYFSAFWPLIVLIAKSIFPEFVDSIMKETPVEVLTLLPSGISLGLNGLLVVYNQRMSDVQFEDDQRKSSTTIRGVAAILLGWGLAAYLILRFFLQES